jgi:hypothetical protein
MPQAQNIVALTFADGLVSSAIATGNNAAWRCRCSRQDPLIGRSGLVQGVNDALRVQCPTCNRSYYVAPNGYDYAAVLEVREIIWP